MSKEILKDFKEIAFNPFFCSFVYGIMFLS